ncbi:ATP-dependent endonuclease [Marinobacter sp. AC-23]|uniref:ATP-dependent nuclease n=1 Tax=Marinobacter sp. AC-23 TaxID=1879031 RepID=UPI0020C88119|nr:ATP-binding protein [Marinobacter sp. AC-23]
MYISEVWVENFRCLGGEGNPFMLPLNPGLTTLVGENDSGKTAAIDAIRYALGTRDQEWLRLTESDFYSPDGGNTRATQIRIRLRFDNLSRRERASFVEHLSYEMGETEKPNTALYLNWIASMRSTHSNARTFFPTEVRSGKDGKGPVLDGLARELLKTTYLRPLRDAEKALASGRSSRLSQVLLQTPEITESGQSFEEVNPETLNPKTLSVLGVGDYTTYLLENREGIEKTKDRLNTEYLRPLSFQNDILNSRISVSTPGNSDFRLRRLLEKLELSLTEQMDSNFGDKRGLGSHNLLFMACELLLLGSDAEGYRYC